MPWDDKEKEKSKSEEGELAKALPTIQDNRQLIDNEKQEYIKTSRGILLPQKLPVQREREDTNPVQMLYGKFVNSRNLLIF